MVRLAIPSMEGVVEELERLFEATESLFPGTVEIHVENDFDEPYEPFFEFGVQGRQGKWTRMTCFIVGWHRWARVATSASPGHRQH